MSDSVPAPRSACLPEAVILTLGSVAPEAIPPDVARHLAACERCQRRALFGARPVSRRSHQPPSVGRALLLAGIVLVVLAMLLLSAFELAGLV